ncbi:unnamed protein product [Lathyrus oleraceus]|uniref:Root cap n=1 Tax=Pisum sativum TaxID=3888 RepID=A0A9D4XHP1_PEA|nr:uncharacterized protein LOC127135527 [Pisum sativum]KAI5420498.1 hypothetical protein KIW84_044337 [Pisum sativum]
MGVSRRNCLIFFVLLSFAMNMETISEAVTDNLSCNFLSSPCFGKKIKCPTQCPLKSPSDPNAKVCSLDCASPVCKTQCKHRKPNCNGRGSACLDPRFIGADGIVFYFHGRVNQHFTLVSDQNLQINARFIGLRPKGRTRDYTWIQALGVLFESHNFIVESTKPTKWDHEIDHLKFSYNGEELHVPQGYLSKWEIQEKKISVERTSNTNSVVVNVHGIVKIYVNVVPVTKEDSRIHNYQIPDNDCFAHLEVQFKFSDLSSKVEGVLGRTYQPNFENPAAKLGVGMPVVGGEDRYRTTSLLSADCGACLFVPGDNSKNKNNVIELVLPTVGMV